MSIKSLIQLTFIEYILCARHMEKMKKSGNSSDIILKVLIFILNYSDLNYVFKDVTRTQKRCFVVSPNPYQMD